MVVKTKLSLAKRRKQLAIDDVCLDKQSDHEEQRREGGGDRGEAQMLNATAMELANRMICQKQCRSVKAMKTEGRWIRGKEGECEDGLLKKGRKIGASQAAGL